MDELLSTVDVGRLAGVGPTAVKRWADQGMLPCVKTAGGHRRFERREVQKFLDSVRGPTVRQPSSTSSCTATAWASRPASSPSGRGSAPGWRSPRCSAGVLAEIGERWRAGRVTILQEHLASERLARALARISDALPVAARGAALRAGLRGGGPARARPLARGGGAARGGLGDALGRAGHARDRPGGAGAGRGRRDDRGLGVVGHRPMPRVCGRQAELLGEACARVGGGALPGRQRSLAGPAAARAALPDHRPVRGAGAGAGRGGRPGPSPPAPRRPARPSTARMRCAARSRYSSFISTPRKRRPAMHRGDAGGPGAGERVEHQVALGWSWRR